MTERVEWEVVDNAPSPGKRPTIQQLMKTLLGPWWRWKIAGTATVAALVVVFFATLTGIFLLLMAAVGIMSIGISKFRQWLRSSDGSLIVRRNVDK
jgi:hypothetical protein